MQKTLRFAYINLLIIYKYIKEIHMKNVELILIINYTLYYFGYRFNHYKSNYNIMSCRVMFITCLHILKIKQDK